MNYLARDTVDLPASLWEGIDETVKKNVRATLIGRRFLDLYGPLGAGVTTTAIDEEKVAEEAVNGFVKTTGRRYAEVPLFYEDFWLTWRDLEAAERMKIPLDYARIAAAARELALKEDQLIFYGNEHLGSTGLLTTEGTGRITRSDWSQDQNAYLQIAEGIAQLAGQVILGSYTLILSPDAYASLLRVQAGLGITEAERLHQLLPGALLVAPVMGKGQAVLVCPEPDYMDLVIGHDIDTAYLETAEMNHHFRIFETAAFRLKNPDAVIVFD